MNKYSLLKEIITLVEEFESKNNNLNVDLDDFLFWMQNKKAIDALVENAECTIPEQKETFRINGEISRHIFRLNRFAAIYAKELLQDSPLISINDFGFVANVHAQKAIAKSELIKLMLMEKSPGMEVIKRLIAKNIFEEFDNQNDKRSKMIRLTPFGLDTIFKTYAKMSKLSDIVCADLNYDTKVNTLKVLQHLDSFHNEIFEKK
jgi:MarR family transcriptional regulator, lower aerobic nicotinate degradation pathway regulator